MKAEIINKLIIMISEELELAIQAMKSSKDLAQSEDFKSESKWDTRSIEAGYLAGAQEKRVKELEVELHNLKSLNIDDKDTMAVGAIVETEDKTYFITVNTGGQKIQVNEKIVHVVSMNSPIGLKLIDEEIEIINFS